MSQIARPHPNPPPPAGEGASAARPDNPPPQAGEGGTRAAGAGGWGLFARQALLVAALLLTVALPFAPGAAAMQIQTITGVSDVTAWLIADRAVPLEML